MSDRARLLGISAIIPLWPNQDWDLDDVKGQVLVMEMVVRLVSFNY